VVVCEARVIQVLPLRRCNESRFVSGAPLAVSFPVIEKDCLTWAEVGAEMVREVGAFASTAGVAVQNSNAQVTSTAATTITPLFFANIPPHLRRKNHTRAT